VIFKGKEYRKPCPQRLEEAITESQVRHLLDSNLPSACQVESIQTAIICLGRDSIHPVLYVQNKR